MAALLKRQDLLEGSGMGGDSRVTTHERARSNARQAIFPAGSPVAHGQKNPPKLLTDKEADKRLSKVDRKLWALVQARKDANEVYGDTYFENHYPLADRDLKTVIAKKVELAHSRLRAKETPEEKPKELPAPPPPKPNVTIVLNIGGSHG